MTWLHLFGMMLIVATVVLLLAGGVALVASLARGRTRTAARIAGALAIWCVLHLGFVALVAAGEPARRLAPGEVKRFCGFYLDCHLGVAVVGARRIAAKQIVTVEISSNAREATLTPYGLTARLVDDSGRRYPPEPTGPLESVAPGGSYRKDFVFDLPATAPGLLVLDVRERGFPDDFLEWLLPGDEDSFLHRGTVLLLPPA